MKHQLVLFEELGTITQGLSVSRYKDDQGNPEIVVNVKDLGSLYLTEIPDLVRLSESANIKRYRLCEGDVVIGIRGTLLNSSVVTQALEGSFPGQNVAVFRADNLTKISPVYIAALMRSEWLKESTSALQKRSSTNLPSIRVSDLRKFSIPLPALIYQKQIARLFSLFESYKTSTVNALDARRELVEMSLFKFLEQ